MKPYNPATEPPKRSNKLDQASGANTRRESAAGVHYAETYGACQRRFMFKYVFGIEEKWVDKALIFGAAFHEGKAIFYTTGSLDAGIDTGIYEIESRRHEFIDSDEYMFTRERLKPLLSAWLRDFGKDDLNRYEILAVEEEVRLPIPFTPGFIHTQRQDALVRDLSTKKVYTMETKTASSSIDLTMNTVRMSTQVSSYIWGGTEVFGSDYGGTIIDVSYWSTRSKNPDRIRNERSEPITKTAYELKKTQVDLASLFNEVDSKQKALKQGVPADFLFRKNPYYCYAYFRKCPYADICSLQAEKASRHLPDHLHVPGGHESNKLDQITWDGLYFGEGAY